MSVDPKIEIPKSEFDALKKDIQLIKTAILGVPEAKIKGMAEAVSDHQTYIEKSKQRHWTIAGITLAGSASGGFSLHKLLEYLSSH